MLDAWKRTRRELGTGLAGVEGNEETRGGHTLEDVPRQEKYITLCTESLCTTEAAEREQEA